MKSFTKILFLVVSYTYEESMSETLSAHNAAYDNKVMVNGHGNHHLCNLHHNSRCKQTLKYMKQLQRTDKQALQVLPGQESNPGFPACSLVTTVTDLSQHTFTLL